MPKDGSSETRDGAAYLLGGQRVTAPPLAPGLYVVATPIGNLRDITLRALETLAAADVILCEDTRTSGKLLDHYGIRTRRNPFHEHNERDRIAPVLQQIAGGGTVALISDAGTPLVSDPGFPLVRAAQDAGHPVFAVPGASALLAALSVAGLPTDAFGFVGFLPPKAEARANAIAALSERRDTLVFYESPRRLVESLRAMVEGLGDDRPAAVALELTKRFERTYRGTLGSLVLGFEEMDEIKGEAVIIVGGAPERIVDEAGWRAALVAALEDQPLRAAVDEITTAFELKRKDVYDAALALKAEK
jgi:16S rRNA (cytidine1402-2'-O)-methyltransferase